MHLLKPIHHTFAPLADAAQVLQALGLLLKPLAWKRGREAGLLEQELQELFGAEAVSFSSGREALLALLQALHLPHGSEVIVQGYTCVVVPNAIQAAGLVPVFADIERGTLNLSVESVERVTTPQTRAVICQHTFGIPSPTGELSELCRKRSLLLIEDCAHILPDKQGPSEVGPHGDCLLLSFGRDKAISGITGGVMICRSSAAIPDLRRRQEEAGDLSQLSLAMLLLYPLLYALARPLYGFGLGKALLKLAATLHILPRILTRKEKEGRMDPALHRLPNACAALAREQLKRLQAFNDNRRMLTRFYLEACAEHSWPVLHGIQSDLPLQKFPMFVKDAEEIRSRLKAANIHLHDGWTGCVVCPPGTDPSRAGYEQGRNPAADAVCEGILSLPTHPTMTLKQAETLVDALASLLQV